MKTQLVIGAMALAVGSLLAADAKDDVKNAAKKLAGTSGYSWKTTTEMGGGGAGGGGGGPRRAGPTEGKIAKDGTICLSMTRGQNTVEAYLVGTKGALKTADGWQSLAEAAEGEPGQQNPARWMARTLQNYKAPAAEAEDLVAKAKDLKVADGACAGELTEEGVKDLLGRGMRRAGGDGPAISNAKGSVKFWLKDGSLARYEYKVQGTMTFNGNDRDIERTTTVEIKDVGSTTVAVPSEAKQKLQ